MNDPKVRWILTPEDVDSLIPALNLVIDILDREFDINWGIQVAANRAAWSAQLKRVIDMMKKPFVATLQAMVTAVAINPTPEEAEVCGVALLIAANRLDSFAGAERIRGDPVARAVVLPQLEDPAMTELVRRHFSPIANDPSWVQLEGLRLRLHAHRLLDHEHHPEQ